MHPITPPHLYNNGTIPILNTLTSIDDNIVYPNFEFKLIDQLFLCKKLISLPAKATLFIAGDTYDGVFQVCGGLLKEVSFSHDGEESICFLYGKKSLIGAQSFFDRGRHLSSVIALSNSTVRFASHREINNFIIENPSFIKILGLNLTNQLKYQFETINSQRFLTAKQKIARIFIHLAQSIGINNGNSIQLTERISQTDIAAMAGISRENVCRILKLWRISFLISHKNGKYVINSLDRFQNEFNFNK